MQVLTRVQPPRESYIASLLLRLFWSLKKHRLDGVQNDTVASQVEKGFEMNRRIHGHRHELRPRAHIREFPCRENAEHSKPSTAIHPGDAMSHTDCTSDKGRSINGGRAQNFQDLGITQVVPMRQNPGRRNDFRWNSERDETLGEALGKAGDASDFVPACYQYFFRTYDLHWNSASGAILRNSRSRQFLNLHSSVTLGP